MSIQDRIEELKRAIGVRSRVTLADGSPVRPGALGIDPETGQQHSYLVLSPDERAKGFVRPVRTVYVHVGRPGPRYPLREATVEEKQSRGQDCVWFEEYPANAPYKGRYWSNAMIGRIMAGCGSATMMDRVMAETYARDPKFYSTTFCARCRRHFPVGLDGEFIWDGSRDPVGT
jgi:hypothetical protein